MISCAHGIDDPLGVPRPKLTAEEKRVARVLHRIGKFHVFLREVHAELFDEAFSAELAAVYEPRGTAPVPPALLAMVMLLQVYDRGWRRGGGGPGAGGPALAMVSGCWARRRRRSRRGYWSRFARG